MSAPAREIRFLAVARRSDKVVLAHRIHTLDKSYDFLQNVQKVLNSPGWASVTTDKLSLEDGPNMFYVLLDEVRPAADGGTRCARRGAVTSAVALGPVRTRTPHVPTHPTV